ncbi:hypothetical protein CNR22_09040 [Sphingobacteriaceae bacterium]|nr:hypothetical protein CNR22_09040 [Sphingobacteriaceae bacterium]
MKQATLIIFLFFTLTTYCQPKQIDTLIILGRKYPLERSKVYYTSNENFALYVIRTMHKGPNKILGIEIFPKSGIVEEQFDASGNASVINYSGNKEKFKHFFYHFSDSIKLDDKSTFDINLKMSGQYFKIDQAEFIVSNDTSSSVVSITTGQDSEPILRKLKWHVKELKPTSVYLTSMYFTDKNRNVNYLPIQFCILLD